MPPTWPFWFLVGLLFTAAQTGAVTAQSTLPLVTLQPLASQQIRVQATFVATVEPVRRTVVGGAVEGRVIYFLGSDDDDPNKQSRVTKGEPLARLEPKMVEIQLAEAKAQLALSQKELLELRNGARPQEIAASAAAQAAAKARMEFAQAKFQRSLGLFDSKSISREQLDSAEAAALEAMQNHEQATAQHELLVAGTRPEQIAQAEARVEAQEQAVRRLEDLLDKYVIRAPFDGYVVAEHTEVGAWLQQGAPVVELIQLDQVELQASVSEQYITGLSTGTEVEVTVEALPDQSLRGTIVRIIPQADLQARTFPVRVRLKNPERNGQHLLMAGMLGELKIPVGTVQPSLVVPKDALVLGHATPRVFVLDSPVAEDGTATVISVDVELGRSQTNLIEVQSPQLSEGQLVVVQGNERLRSGQLVQVQNRNLGDSTQERSE